MTPLLLLFVFLWCVLAGIGDVCYKQWSILPARPLHLLAIGSIAYMLDTFLWAGALVRGLPMAKGSVLMCMLSLITGVAIGIHYGEPLTKANYAGIGFALVAIVLLD